MKRILFVTNESNHGGAEKMLIWLANKMAEYDCYQIYFCNLNSNSPFYSLNNKIKLILFDRPLNENFIYRNTIGFIQKSWFINSIIKKNKIDMVVNFNDHAYYNILFCRLFTKFKILVSQRVDPSSIVSKTGRFRLKLIKYADGLVCQTKPALDFFDSIFSKSAMVIPNPIYTKYNMRWEPQKAENIIINVARLELKQKRQDILLDAFSIVHKKYSNLKLFMYGAKIENDYQRIMKQIEDLSLTDCVKYCGVSSNIQEEMLKAKLLVLSSDYEGIPNAILEGMALGMPIVSTDCKPGGARMLLENKYGVLVECGDAKALADAIIDVLDNFSEAIEMGQRAYESTYRFDEQEIAEQWEKYIKKLL